MSEIDTSKLPQGGKGFVHDFAADQTTFKGVPWESNDVDISIK